MGSGLSRLLKQCFRSGTSAAKACGTRPFTADSPELRLRTDVAAVACSNLKP